jgi:hypothetical protein
VEAIQWSTVGILSQAWPKEHAELWGNAYRTAAATLEQLKKEKRTEEAQAFEAALNQAMVRDCVVVVSWTGEADVDLQVEEPAGTVCSFRTPRTTSGGIMLGDTYAMKDVSAGAGFSEVYVCPQGFDGTYRMLLRRVWGKPTAGKVTVEVFTHYNTDQNQRMRKVIPLGSDDALVTFDLVGGRRQQALAEEQVANAVKQEAARRDILAQQLAGLASNGGPDGQAAGVPNRFANGLAGRRSAVGYMPVIVTLPEGANLVAQAVISADRRYVRITSMPFFSGISEVNTFNFASGSSGGGQGGTGGQGFSGVGGGQGGGGGLGGGGFGGGGGGFGGGGGGMGGMGGGMGGMGGGMGGMGGGMGGMGGGMGAF